MSIDRTRHIRRVDQTPTRGRWGVECDCGWRDWTDQAIAGRALAGVEVSEALDQLFIAHLPDDERELYLLIDQRQVEGLDEAGEPMTGPRGNFIMPLGTPCLLTRWHEAAGVRWGHYLVPDTGQAGELPVGEIRTADNRVFRLDCPA